MNTCKHCNLGVATNYCGNCGRPIQLKRIDSHYIVHEIEHVLHFEKGIFFTIRELLTQPGNNIRKFFTEDRNRLVKPIIFIIVTSLIYSVINHYFHIEKSYAGNTKQTASTAISVWIQQHYGYANMVMGIFIAFSIKLFFRKHHYNLFEILIMLCFVMGMGMLIFAMFALFQGLFSVKLMEIAGLVALLYSAWAIGQFFGPRPVNYIKAFFAYLLGLTAFTFAAVLLGTLIDLTMK